MRILLCTNDEIIDLLRSKEFNKELGDLVIPSPPWRDLYEETINLSIEDMKIWIPKFKMLLFDLSYGYPLEHNLVVVSRPTLEFEYFIDCLEEDDEFNVIEYWQRQGDVWKKYVGGRRLFNEMLNKEDNEGEEWKQGGQT